MKIILTLIITLTGLKSYSQTIANVTSSQQGNNAVISYDLNGLVGAFYYVKLFYSTDGGQNFSNELLQVTGDVKSGVKTGIAKKIIWAAEREVNYLNGQVIFKVEAESRRSTAKPVTVSNVTVEIVSAKRNGEDILIEFTVTQNTEDEVKEIALIKESKLNSQDGRQFEPVSGKFGTKTIGDSGAYNVQCPKGIPTKGFLTFRAESSDLVIPAVTIKLSPQGSFVVRNIPVQ